MVEIFKCDIYILCDIMKNNCFYHLTTVDKYECLRMADC